MLPLLAVAVVAAILVVDHVVLPNGHLPRVIQGLEDEPAHALTALVLLAALNPAWLKRFSIAVGSAAILIDADHLPKEFGYDILTRGTTRPYSHSFATVAMVLLVTLLLPAASRGIGLAVALGLLAHFLRDVATNALPLLWPLTREDFRIPYLSYALILVAAAGIIVLRSRSDAARAAPGPARAAAPASNLPPAIGRRS